MAHFNLFVIGDDIRAQLLPFKSFDDETNFPKKYLKFRDAENQYIQSYNSEKHTIPAIVFNDPSRKPVYAPSATIGEFIDGNEVKSLIPNEVVSFDYYMTEILKFEKDPETGRHGDWHNPNGRWDYYSLGGRWSHAFRIKPNADISYIDPDMIETTTDGINTCDQARLKDIDFEALETVSRRGYLKLHHKIRACIDDERATSLTARSQMQSDEEYIQQPNAIPILKDLRAHDNWKYISSKAALDILTQTSADYVDTKVQVASWLPFALLHDGQWHASRKFLYEENDEECAAWSDFVRSLLRSLPGDTLISNVDCHT